MRPALCGRRLRLPLLLAGLAVAALAFPATAQPLDGRGGAVESLLARHDVRFPEGFTDGGAGVWWTDVAHPGAHFIRLRFVDVRDAGSDDYKVVVLGGNLTAVETLPRPRFAARASFWTVFVPGSSARVMVVAAEPGPLTGVAFRVGEYVAGAPGAVLESVRDLQNPKFRPVAAYASNAGLQAAARTVAKLRGAGRSGLETCTGFMVGSSLLLTNEHCVPNATICESTIVYFDWTPASPEPQTGRFPCAELVQVNSALDYALVKLDGDPGRPDRWGHLRLDPPAPAPAPTSSKVPPRPMYVVQYPGIAEEKQVALEGCALTTPLAPGVDKTKRDDLGHSCDTKTGSSGSPVLDMQHRVVGLHHWSFDVMDGRWNFENRAVRMERILDAIGTLLK